MTTYQISSETERSQVSESGFQADVSGSGLTRSDAALALAAAAVALILYGRTAAPGLLAGDGGEFQTLTYLLGSTHPTGYPVYLALARLFSLLPTGELAYRVNLFSAVMGALTIAGVYLCGRLLSGFRAAAAAGALALAVSPTLWSQALIAEVYTAGAAFFVFILFALLWWDRSSSNKALLAAGLLGGMSLGVHMSVALLAPAVLLFLLLHWRRGWQMWKTAVLGAFSGLAVTIILFLLLDWNNPTASYFNSVIEPSHSAWGYEAQQIDGALEHLWFGWQGRQFQYLMFADVAEVMPQQAADYWANLGSELATPLILLAVLGAVYLLLRRPRAAALLIGALIIQLFYFFNYEIWDLYVFFIPSYLILALLAVAGLGGLIDFIIWAFGQLFNPPKRIKTALDIIFALLVLAFAVWPIFQPQQEAFIAGEVPFDFDLYPQYDKNLVLITEAVVTELPQNAILFTDWDMMWPYYHVAHLQNGRSDLTFIETFPADNLDGVAGSVITYVLDNVDDRPIFFEESPTQLEEMDNLHLSPTRIGSTRLIKVNLNQ